MFCQQLQNKSSSSGLKFEEHEEILDKAIHRAAGYTASRFLFSELARPESTFIRTILKQVLSKKARTEPHSTAKQRCEYKTQISKFLSEKKLEIWEKSREILRNPSAYGFKAMIANKVCDSRGFYHYNLAHSSLFFQQTIPKEGNLGFEEHEMAFDIASKRAAEMFFASSAFLDQAVGNPESTLIKHVSKQVLMALFTNSPKLSPKQRTNYKIELSNFLSEYSGKLWKSCQRRTPCILPKECEAEEPECCDYEVTE